jgi:hypothetical protein
MHGNSRPNDSRRRSVRAFLRQRLRRVEAALLEMLLRRLGKIVVDDRQKTANADRQFAIDLRWLPCFRLLTGARPEAGAAETIWSNPARLHALRPDIFPAPEAPYAG